MEIKINLGSVYTSGPKVMPGDIHLMKSSLAIKGDVAKTLVDGDEVIFNMFGCADGHLKQAALVRIQKQGDDEAHLIYQKPLVILEKLGDKCKKKLLESSGLKMVLKCHSRVS